MANLEQARDDYRNKLRTAVAEQLGQLDDDDRWRR